MMIAIGNQDIYPSPRRTCQGLFIESNKAPSNHNFELLQAKAKMASKPTVAIIGNGWAGFTLAEALSTKKYDITVVSPVRTIQYTPLLASAAAGMFNFR